MTEVDKKLQSQLNQLTLREKEHLSSYLADEIGVKPNMEDKMLREDIGTKVIALIERETGECVSGESLSNQIDLKTFSETLIEEFDLEDMPLSNIMEWQTVEDIVKYLEDNLENEPYISPFELEN